MSRILLEIESSDMYTEDDIRRLVEVSLRDIHWSFIVREVVEND
jgi:hypothetical protein